MTLRHGRNESQAVSEEDVLRVGVIDLQQGNAWKEIGRSTSWGWQQGCMLQWIPGSRSEVIWNDHGDHGFVSRVCNVETGEVRTVATFMP